MPCQNTGTDRPSNVPTRVTLSIARSRRLADRIPAGMPSISAKPTASDVSSIVTGNRSRISVTTGLPVRHDVPRSPWARAVTQRPYCCHHGWSRPKNRFSSATIAGLTMASAPIICSTTVPGTRRSMRKTRRDRPRSVRAIEYRRTARYRVMRCSYIGGTLGGFPQTLSLLLSPLASSLGLTLCRARLLRSRRGAWSGAGGIL